MLRQITHQPPQAVLLTGPQGIGKNSLALTVVAGTLDKTVEELSNFPYVRIISPDDKAKISIEVVRELHDFVARTVPGSRALSRAIIINDTDAMTVEAQNALLKTLEEPPTDTILVLTSAYPEQLLTTIRSRCQRFDIIPPVSDDLRQFFLSQGTSQQTVDMAMTIAGELPGLATALIEQSDHPLQEAISYARGLLQSKLYERLLLVDSLAKQKALSLDICFVLEQMSHIALIRAKDAAAVSRWQQIMQAAYAARERISHNTQAKLVLTELMLALS